MSYAENSDWDPTRRIAARGGRTPMKAVRLPHGAGSRGARALNEPIWATPESNIRMNGLGDWGWVFS